MPNALPRPWMASPRLRLDEFSTLNADDIVNMHADPRMRSQLIDDYPIYTPDAARQFLGNLKRFYRLHEGLGIWRTERLAQTEAEVLAEAQAAVDAGEVSPKVMDLLRQPSWVFCGWFNLMPSMHLPDEVEIGARLTPDAWGGQLVMDGGEWLLQHAFQQLQRERVLGICNPANRSAIHSLRALGFGEPEAIAYDGQNALQFAINADQWRVASARPRRARVQAALKVMRA